jgi:hypothetical protein
MPSPPAAMIKSIQQIVSNLPYKKYSDLVMEMHDPTNRRSRVNEQSTGVGFSNCATPRGATDFTVTLKHQLA